MYAQASVETTPHERLFAHANLPERWPPAAPFTYKGLRDIRDPVVLMTLIDDKAVTSDDEASDDEGASSETSETSVEASDDEGASSEASESSDEDSQVTVTARASDGDDDAEVRSVC